MHGPHSLVRCGNSAHPFGKCTTQMVTQSANLIYFIGKHFMILSSVILTKDTEVIRSLLIYCDQWNFMIPVLIHKINIRKTRFAEWWWPMKSREKVKWPITRCFFKPIKVELIKELSSILAYLPKLTGHAFFFFFLLLMKQILSYMSRWGTNKSLKLFPFVTWETANSSPELMRTHLMGTWRYGLHYIQHHATLSVYCQHIYKQKL